MTPSKIFSSKLRKRVSKHPRKRRTATRRQRLAATLVEFALVSNILFLTIFTCMEFAQMNMARNLAQDAAYYAARTAIVPGATAAEAEAEADRIMGLMFADGSAERYNLWIDWPLGDSLRISSGTCPTLPDEAYL
jgi:hypothetical protein